MGKYEIVSKSQFICTSMDVLAEDVNINTIIHNAIDAM